MVKSSFQQVYQKSIKFYDFHYHLHKSSFKGLSTVLKDYSDCQKQYADKLIDISKSIATQIPDLNTEMPAVKNSIHDLRQTISTFSQLHFNYSERLAEISSSLNSEYNSSKKLKQKHMKVLKQQLGDNLQTVNQSKIKSKITNVQSQVCKTLYEHLDTYTQEQYSRTQKLKDQILIYFALTKKIQQKQMQLVNKYKVKISKEETQIKINQIDNVGEQLINQYNSYLDSDTQGQRLSIKKYDRMQSVQVMRQSLKQSTILREKIANIDNFKSRISNSLNRFEKLPQKLMELNMFLSDKNKTQGFFDIKILKQSQSYSNALKTVIIKKISFDMMNCYFHSLKGKTTSETKLILSTIKANLKIKDESLSQNFKTVEQFNEFQLNKMHQMDLDPIKSKSNKEYQSTLLIILALNQIYFTHEEQFRQKDAIVQQNIVTYLRNAKEQQKMVPKLKHKKQFHLKISNIFIKHLLSSLIIVKQGEPILIDQYKSYIQQIQKFALTFFGLKNTLVKLLFLSLLQNAIRSTRSVYVQEICLLIENYQSNISKGVKASKVADNQTASLYQRQLVADLIVKCTQGIVNFYKLGIPLINFYSILVCIQNLATQKFSAVQYFHKCIKRAGCAYIFWVDEEKKLIQPAIWQGQMRLKNLVQTIQMLQFETLQESHFIPTSNQMAHILGVDQCVIIRKMKNQFLEALSQIIEQNLDLLYNQEGIDKEGYILKLGVFLVQLDIPSFKKIDFQNKYFKVLDIYLTSTQNEYNSLLDHSRKTEIWIMQENTLATQNCIDFCSLLYKPFEFLLSTLKVLIQENKTQFTQQFSQFIKNKLNNILKEQIFKYVNFLYDSLRKYTFAQPEISYKPKKSQNIIQSSQQQKLNNTRIFKQVIRRVYNLNFLKDQLEQIIHDFLEQQVYQDLGNSIFNLSNLSKATTKYKQYKQILNNLRQIAQSINTVEDKIVTKISDISVFYFMKRVFHNLYFQQQKSTFQQIFSTKNDYKLSSYTFVKYQKDIQELFMMIEKQIPSEISQKYYSRLISSFFKALKFEMLNSCKFKMPKTKDQIARYLDEDTSFLCTFLKQKFISPKIIEKQLQRPLKKVLSSLQAQTKELIQQFETQSLNNNNQQCKYILIILYLRNNDEKALQFFKKYKSLVFK